MNSLAIFDSIQILNSHFRLNFLKKFYTQNSIQRITYCIQHLNCIELLSKIASLICSYVLLEIRKVPKHLQTLNLLSIKRISIEMFHNWNRFAIDLRLLMNTSYYFDANQ